MLKLTEFRISRLVEFYDEGVMHFDIGLDELQDQQHHLAPEEWDEFGDIYADQRYDLEELLKLKRHFAIVGLFTAFEMFLRGVIRLLHHPADAMVVKRIRGMRIAEMKKEFAILGVPITRPDPDWHAIMGIIAVRNCITHADGRANEKRAKNLASYQIPVDQSNMMLPERYFGESVVLVARTCKRIAKDCRAAQREGRIKIQRPTVAGLMDALLERSQGVTWSELSKRAQALADHLGHKTKWTIAKVREHARYRHRQHTGRWGNLSLKEFEGQPGGRLFGLVPEIWEAKNGLSIEPKGDPIQYRVAGTDAKIGLIIEGPNKWKKWRIFTGGRWKEIYDSKEEALAAVLKSEVNPLKRGAT